MHRRSLSFCKRCGACHSIQPRPEFKSIAAGTCQHCGGGYTPSWLTYLLGGGIIFLLFETADIPWSGLFAGLVMLAVPFTALRQQLLLFRARRYKP